MNKKTKLAIIEDFAMDDMNLALMNQKYVLETSVFHQTGDKVTAIVGGKERTYEWCEKVNHAYECVYVAWGKQGTLVRYI